MSVGPLKVVAALASLAYPVVPEPVNVETVTEPSMAPNRLKEPAVVHAKPVAHAAHTVPFRPKPAEQVGNAA